MGKKSRKGNNNKKKGGGSAAAAAGGGSGGGGGGGGTGKSGVFITTLTGKKRKVRLTHDGMTKILQSGRSLYGDHPHIKNPITVQVLAIVPKGPDDNWNELPKLVLSDGKYYYCIVQLCSQEGASDKGENLRPNSIILVKDFFNAPENTLILTDIETLGHTEYRIGKPIDVNKFEEDRAKGKLIQIDDLITLNRSWNFGGASRLKTPYILQIIDHYRDDNPITTAASFYDTYTLSDGIHYFSNVYIGREEQLIPKYAVIRIYNFFRDEDGVKKDPSRGGVVILSYDILNWKGVYNDTMIGNPIEIKLRPLSYYIDNKEVNEDGGGGGDDDIHPRKEYEKIKEEEAKKICKKYNMEYIDCGDGSNDASPSPSPPQPSSSSQVSDPTNTITEGAIRKLYSMKAKVGTYTPILQIVKLASQSHEEGAPGFWVSLSDGEHRCVGVLPKAECNLINSGEIRVNSLIKVQPFVTSDTPGIMGTIFGFAIVEKVGDLAEIVGNPINIDDTSMVADGLLFGKPEGDTAPVTKNPMDSNHENVQKALPSSTPPATMITTENEVASFTIRYESELKKMQMSKKRTNNKVEGNDENNDETKHVMETKSVKTPKSRIPFRLEILPDGNNEHRRNNGWVSFYLLCMDSCPTKTVHAIGFIRHYRCDDANNRQTHIADIPFEKKFDYVGDYWPITRMIRSTDVETHCLNERGEWNIEIHFTRIQVKNTLRGFKTFYADKLSKLRSDHPKFSFDQINDTLTDIWRNLSDKEKGEWMIKPPPGFIVFFIPNYQTLIERWPTPPVGKQELILKKQLIDEWRDMTDESKQRFNKVGKPISVVRLKIISEFRLDDDNFDDVTLMDLIKAIW